MHSHDLDLIAALADGTLEDETRALSRVESCPDCRAEFETQKSVLTALGGVEPAAMTDHEKAALHRDLWTALRTGEPAPHPTTPWWYRWSYAAAGLFIVVGLVAVISQMTGGGDSTAELEATVDIAGEAEETPEAGAEEPTEAATQDVPAADDGADVVGEAGSAPEADESAEQDAAGTPSAAASVDFAVLAQTLNKTRLSSQTFSALDQSEYVDCLTEAELEDHMVIETYSLEAGDYVAVTANDAPDDSEEIFFVDVANCEVVHTEG